MNIIQAREAAIAGKIVISPRGDVWATKDFNDTIGLGADLIFGEWKIKIEPVVFEAYVMSTELAMVVTSNELKPFAGKLVRVTVETLGG